MKWDTFKSKHFLDFQQTHRISNLKFIGVHKKTQLKISSEGLIILLRLLMSKWKVQQSVQMVTFTLKDNLYQQFLDFLTIQNIQIHICTISF